MARLTKTATPTLHGHYDGDLTLDMHRHDGGDRVHGHPDKQSLGRVIEAKEYIPPARLDEVQEGVEIVQRAADQTKRRLTGLADPDAPTAPLPTATPVVRNGGDKISRNDQAVASFVAHLANLAEHERWGRIYGYEITTVIGLAQVLEQAERSIANRDHVPHELVRRGLAMWSNWASQIGALKEDES